MVTSCSSINDKPRSPYIIATKAAASSWQSEVRTNSKVVARARAAPITSILNNAVGPIVEIDSKQDLEIHNIIRKEDVDRVVHYLVEWNPTLVLKYALKNAKEMMNKFEARLRAQARQKKGRVRLQQSKLS